MGAFDRSFTEKKNAANHDALRSIVFKISISQNFNFGKYAY